MPCPHCSSEADGVWSDEGVGAYEYGSIRAVDVRWRLVCPDCGGSLPTRYTSPREQARDERAEYNAYMEDV